MEYHLFPKILFLLTLISVHFPKFTLCERLKQGLSLSVENPGDVLVSRNKEFSAGFYEVGENAYSFAIWFNKPSCSPRNLSCTVVWMANRGQPVNGKRSKLTLLGSGNLMLTDVAQLAIWETKTESHNTVELHLSDIGNLILDDSEGAILWQSFDFPTDTLLPMQVFSGDNHLVSDRSAGNSSAGFYRLFFDDDNVIRLAFDGSKVSSLYWYEPWLVSSKAGRSTLNNTRIAVYDSLGSFKSSDGLSFRACDYGASFQRRLKLDVDGNLRLYSREKRSEKWVVSWQAIQQPCSIHGICGKNSLCSYTPHYGRKCSCLLGYKLSYPTDWSYSYGCKPDFKFKSLKNSAEVSFIQLSHVEFYGHDFDYVANSTMEHCSYLCSSNPYCKGFQYIYTESIGYECRTKLHLRHGYQSPSSMGDFYLKLPRVLNLSSYYKKLEDNAVHDCLKRENVKLDRKYKRSHLNGTLGALFWFALGLGVIEIICFLLVFCALRLNKPKMDMIPQGYIPIATRFRRLTFAEMKKATNNFSEEIGRGGEGTVYKGFLPDKGAVAVKQLNDAHKGEAEFLTEVTTIGMLNHMNLINMWGYCLERKYRLLVYEFMEHGSLADKLKSSSDLLDWKKRFKIALGTARGLAYLHEECLDWVLHCDVKPQNILLDSEYHPKISDFGLSKLLVRGDEKNNSGFSSVRGTRGYMAPEWVFNLPITSKVDVYSFGIVVLEMVTGNAPTTGIEGGGDTRLVNWVRGKWSESDSTAESVREIIDPKLGDGYVASEVEVLITAALQCVREDRYERPTMGLVLEMLSSAQGRRSSFLGQEEEP